LGWIERAIFTDGPLVALLYRFFALEALLGDKSSGLKGEQLAFRRATLSRAVTWARKLPIASHRTFTSTGYATAVGRVGSGSLPSRRRLVRPRLRRTEVPLRMSLRS